jgi:hypothetical protein
MHTGVTEVVAGFGPPYVYLPLYLATQLLSAAVPQPVLKALQPHDFDARLFDWARDRVLEPQHRPLIVPDLLQLWKGPQITDRTAVLKKILSPAVIAKYYAIPLTSKKMYLYYPLRLTHLVRRYGPMLWRLMCHHQPLTALAEGHAQLAHWLGPYNKRAHSKNPGFVDPKKSFRLF